MIPQRYVDIIEQAEQRLDELSDYERCYITGIDQKTGEVSKWGPLRDRSYLSLKQQNMLDRIACERFEGGKWDNRTVRLEYDNVDAVRTDEGFIVRIEGVPVGTGIAKKEAGTIAAWLAASLEDIRSALGAAQPAAPVQEQVEDEPF